MWSVIFLLLLEMECCLSDKSLLGVSIYPPQKSIVRLEKDDLNLTCKVGLNKTEKSYELTWSLPIKANSDSDRVSIYKGYNELTVTIHQLQEDDSGPYICEVTGDGLVLKRKIKVLVKTGKEKCYKAFFTCGNGLCIPRRYMCDGYADCPGGSDESETYCGKDPCHGRILCDDGRCIPKKLCCDPAEDQDCSVNYLVPCCNKIFHHEEMESSVLPVLHRRYNDINFLQSTIYTIVSCAVAFVFITIIMIVAICRIQMRRSALEMQSSRPHHSANGRWLWPWLWSTEDRNHRREASVNASWADDSDSNFLNNEERFLNGNGASLVNFPYSSHSSDHENFVLVTYNRNDGVQLVECLPKPPPYSEASLPRRCIGPPPPPYRSENNIADNSTESGQRLVHPDIPGSSG